MVEEVKEVDWKEAVKNPEVGVLFSFITMDDDISTTLVPTVPTMDVSEFFDDNYALVSFPIEFLENDFFKKKMKGFVFLATNDPTPSKATDVVSLGYYAMRFSVKNFLIESLNPLVLRVLDISNIADKKMEFHYTRPIRRVY